MKKTKRNVLGMIAGLFICFIMVCVNVQAAAPANVIKAEKAATGRLVTTKKGVRYYNTYTGKYTKSKWLKVKGNIYYFCKNGYAKKGWKTHNGKRYYFASNGKLVTGWRTIGGKKYYIWKNHGNLSGSVATGKIKISTGTYDFSSTGVMQTGWKKIGSYYYYFYPYTGKMAVNTKLGKYKVDKNGRRVTTSFSDTQSSKEIYWVGDSRTVGLGSANGISSKCIAKVGEGHDWYITTAEKKLKNVLKKNPTATVVLNFGVNDHVNITKYINSYRKLIKQYPKAKIYFMSVNPIDSKYTAGYTSNTRINNFNKKLKAAFPDRYLDVNSYLKKTGFKTVDGLHYTAATYKKIYSYVLSKV